MTAFLVNHLWQSTLFALAAGMLALALRRHGAHLRYWIWLAASAKFLLPFALFVSIGATLSVQTHPVITEQPVLAAVQHIAAPIAASEPSPLTVYGAPTPFRFQLLLLAWSVPCVGLLMRWLWQWLQMKATLRTARPVRIECSIPIRSTAAALEPGVFGVFRPVLVMPAAVLRSLSHPQLQALIAHELAHVRRCDNLTATLHRLVEAIFWFHPLVWWIGARLAHERELACDATVVQAGGDPHDYAEAILHVCKLYVNVPNACSAGVAGGNLKLRIAAILNHSTPTRLSDMKRALLSAIAGLVVAGPLALGVSGGAPARTQLLAEEANPLRFVSASVFEVDAGTQGGMGVTPDGFAAAGMTLNTLIRFAYDRLPSQIVGGPAWIDSARFNIEGHASPENGMDGAAQNARIRSMLRTLLADKFQLRISEVHEPVYILAAMPEGTRLKASKNPANAGSRIRRNAAEMAGEAASSKVLASALAAYLSRPVLDHTGLTETYDFILNWRGPAEAETLGTALREQLGLSLSSFDREVLQITHVSRPTQDANMNAQDRIAAR